MKKIVVIIAMLSVSFWLVCCQKAQEVEKKDTKVQKPESKRPFQSNALTPPVPEPPISKIQKKEDQAKHIKPPKPTDPKEKSETRYLHLIEESTAGVPSPWAADEAEYTNDLCTMMEHLWKDGDQPKYFELIIKIVKNDKIAAVRSCAASSLRYKKIAAIETNKENIVSSLKNALQDKTIQVEAAGTLMTWGEYDIALPVLDQGAREGNTWALAYLFKGYELFDSRGKDILIRALDYPSDEVKIVAAAEMAKRGWEKNRTENIAIEVLERISRNKQYGNEESRTQDFARLVLEQNKSQSRRAIDLLEKIANRPEALYDKRAIYKTIENLKAE